MPAPTRGRLTVLDPLEAEETLRLMATRQTGLTP
jgi:hypothetical protein